MNPNQSKGTQAAIVEQLAENIRTKEPGKPEWPRVNAYVCQKCGHIEFTVDCANGTTPMALPCLSPPDDDESLILDAAGQPAREATRCDGVMMSAYYAITPDEYDLESINYEWRAPSVDYYLQTRQRNPELAEHLMNGGLILCNRNPANPVLLNDGRYQQLDGTFLGKKDEERVKGDLEKLSAVCAMHKAKERRKERLRAQKRQKQKASNRSKAKAKRKAKRR